MEENLEEDCLAQRNGWLIVKGEASVRSGIFWYSFRSVLILPKHNAKTCL